MIYVYILPAIKNATTSTHKSSRKINNCHQILPLPASIATLLSFLTSHRSHHHHHHHHAPTITNTFSIHNPITIHTYVYRFGETGRKLSAGRTSSNAWCRQPCLDNPHVQSVMRKIEEVTRVPSENYENFQVLRYEQGQRYNVHHDMGE